MTTSKQLRTGQATRRSFLMKTAGAGLVLSAARALPQALTTPDARRKAAVIGHSGRGDYGHNLDMIFQNRPGVELVAVADADPSGLAEAVRRTGARSGYADYRDMLKVEKPSLVSVAPRWTDQHYAMAKAALEAGAHVYMEKPFTQTLEEADELLETARRKGCQIAVAHQMRLAPSTLFLKKQLEEGLIGDLLQIRAHGKQDARAGAEDMIVLGSHLFDLIRFYAGDPKSCTARVLQDGHPIRLEDVRFATENLGPIAGNEIEAQFECDRGVTAFFTSRASYQTTAGPWGMDFIGSRGVIRLLMHMVPRIYLRRTGERSETGWNDQWTRLEEDPGLGLPRNEQDAIAGNRRAVNDWTESIVKKRPPVCSGENAMKSVEMMHAVFQAGLTNDRVGLPLKNRKHPLAR